MQKQSADNMHQQGTKNAPSMFAVLWDNTRVLRRRLSKWLWTIGYYEAWSYARQCDSVAPEDIDANLWTHINFAFGLIHPETFQLSKMNSYDDQLYPRVANLKLQNPSLKVFIAIGGWDAGGKVFSDMVSTAENRATFIKSVVQFCQTQAFDGIDIDWEYPVADDRGGRAEDFANYVTFVKELRSAAGRLGISLTLPSSYWYLKGFDVVNLEPYVDWFNFMSYDIHGTWDGNNAYTKQVVNPHTNLTEISQGLDLLWRNNIPSKKVVLGLGFYGRSFTLSDPSCNTPGCPFASGANPGECTGQAGILSNAEINRVIRTHDLTPVMDKAAGVKYITWDNNQWVSYDDADTLKIKMDFANKLGLGGTMVWALDLDNADSQSAQYLNSGGNMTNTNGFSIAKKAADTQQAVAAKLAFWTPCMTEKERKVLGCPGGYHELLVGHGKVYDADDFRAVEGCHGSLNRLLCLSNEAVGRNCAWNRRPDGSKICDQRCPKGTIYLTQNTHPAGDKKDCAHGTYISVCCEDIETIAQVCPNQYSSDIIFSGSFSNMGAVDSSFSLKSATSKRDNPEASDVSSEIDQTLSSVSDSRYSFQSFDRRAYDGYDPSNPCDMDFDYDFPQPPRADGYIPAYGFYMLYGGSGSYGLGPWPANPPKGTVTSTVTPASRTRDSVHVTKTCDGQRYPQACANIRSAATWYGLRTLACPDQVVPYNRDREGPEEWSSSHHKEWKSWITSSVWAPYAGMMKDSRCQADEWPPFNIWGSRNKGNAGIIIRYLPGGENGGLNIPQPSLDDYSKSCANQPLGVANDPGSKIRVELDCGAIPPPVTTSTSTIRTYVGLFTDTVWVQEHLTSTVTSIVMDWKSIPVVAGDPDLLTANDCWPRTLYPDAEPGFALLADDGYYFREGIPFFAYRYTTAPAASVTVHHPAGKSKPVKRSVERALEVLMFDDDTARYVIDDCNSTRPANSSELAEHLGIEECEDPECTKEKEHLRRHAAKHRRRLKYIRENRDEVQSMIVAGIDSPMDFKTAGGPISEVLTHHSEPTLPATTRISPSIATSIPMRPGISIQTPVPQETQRCLA
ncbi:hypothetical protein KXW63_007635 [Aspergillus fumigatus]|nr:hypothetical protein KXW63_007635 [Aspergillus fumigatus]